MRASVLRACPQAPPPLPSDLRSAEPPIFRFALVRSACYSRTPMSPSLGSAQGSRGASSIFKSRELYAINACNSNIN